MMYLKNSITLFLLFVITVLSHAQTQRGIDIDGESEGDESGKSVALSSSGNILAIGALKNDGSGSNNGHVRIYEWSDGLWIQKGVDIDGENDGDNSGHSVAISSDGNTIAIGAPKNDGTASNAGHCRVFNWDGFDWVQKGVDIDGEAEGDESGYSVSMSSDGNSIAIGARRNDGSAMNSGHVRVYAWDGSDWVQKGLDIDGEALLDESGGSVSMSSDGNIVAIGARYNQDIGHVRIYEWAGAAWLQKGVDIDGEADFDESGASVSISADGNIVAIGAQQNSDVDVGAGHVRVYEWDGSTWLQKGIDIDGEAYGDESGCAVSISSDGNIVAIGAHGNSDAGSAAGHVRVYKWDGATWIQNGIDIDGEALLDESGLAVSLNSDGDIVAIGAPGNAGAGSFSGHVRVYDLLGTPGATITENQSHKINLYPNPSSDIVSIQSRDALIESIKLYNSMSQLVMSRSVSGTVIELNLKGLERGIYSVLIETSKGQSREQIVLQ